MKSYNGRIMRWSLLLCTICIVTPASADERSIVTAAENGLDGQVTIAVHPYFAKTERAIIERLPEKHLVPIGVLVQNYGPTRLLIGSPGITTPDQARGPVTVRPYTPYGDRPVGAMASGQFFTDGRKINHRLYAQFGARRPVPLVGVNEIFHRQWLPAGEAFYGLVYIDARTTKLRPTRLHTLQGLRLHLPVVALDSGKKAELMISLDGQSIPVAPITTSGHTPAPSAASSFEYLGPPSRRPTPRTMVEVGEALQDCFSRRVGKMRYDPLRYGAVAQADVEFSASGSYLSHAVTSNAVAQPLVPRLNRLVQGMTACDLPAPAVHRAPESTVPYYRARFSIGDPAARLSPTQRVFRTVSARKPPPAVRPAVRKTAAAPTRESCDPSHSLCRILQQYRAQVRSHIKQQWVVPTDLKALPPSQRPEATINIQMTENGRIINTSWTHPSGHEALDRSITRALQHANPLPAPPAKIRERIVQEGIDLTFKSF